MSGQPSGYGSYNIMSLRVLVADRHGIDSTPFPLKLEVANDEPNRQNTLQQQSPSENGRQTELSGRMGKRRKKKEKDEKDEKKNDEHKQE